MGVRSYIRQHQPPWLGGCIALPVTPFEEDGQVDLFAFEKQLSFLAQAGCRALALGFPAGECYTLRDEEYRLLLEDAVLFFGGKMPVIAGVFAPCTQRALSLALIASDAGASALFCPPPPFLRQESAGYFSHVNELSRACDLPLILSFSGHGGEFLQYRELARLPSVIAFAQKTDSLVQGQLFLSALAPTPLLCTADTLLYAAGRLGYSSAFSALATLFPGKTQALFQKEGQGNAALQIALTPLCRMLDGSDGCALLKWALHRKGLCTPAMRLPGVMPQRDLLIAFERSLEQAKRQLCLP
ncbi:MAG: dihydrodipicolinate synthase family protein [Clostridia bacterium]|nr:dihydrodipicolinate synthase family protein [Clostridia bacterium]